MDEAIKELSRLMDITPKDQMNDLLVEFFASHPDITPEQAAQRMNELGEEALREANAMATLGDMLQPVFAAHPGITVGEALKIRRGEQNEANN